MKRDSGNLGLYVFGESCRFQSAREQEIAQHSILRSFTQNKSAVCSVKLTSVQPRGGDP